MSPPDLVLSPPSTLPESPDTASPPLPRVGELSSRLPRGAPETRAAVVIARRAKNDACMFGNENWMRVDAKRFVGEIRIRSRVEMRIK